jgi:hypothetical protein
VPRPTKRKGDDPKWQGVLIIRNVKIKINPKQALLQGLTSGLREGCGCGIESSADTAASCHTYI